MRLGICVLLLPVLCIAGTIIQDTIHTGFPPQAFGGRVTISGPAMTTSDGKMISRWTREFQISDGQFQVELEPNDTAMPSGTSYYVVYRPKSGMAWSEYWVVPTSATPLKISGVRVTQPPVPQMGIQPSQILAGGASDGQALVWSDGLRRWSPSTLSAGVGSVFGRTGAVTAQAGDYDTDKVPEGGVNRYYLDSRARAAFSAQGPLAYDSGTGLFSCPTCAALSGGVASSMAYWTGDGSLGPSSVVSTHDANKQVALPLRDGASVTFGSPAELLSPVSIDIRPPDSSAAPNYPQGFRVRFLNADGTFDEANNSYIDLAPWSQRASLTNFAITGMVKRLKSFTYSTYPSGTGTLTTHSCGASDGCPPNSSGDYLYTVLYYLTTTAASGGTAFLTVTWTDMKGARTFVSPALPLNASGYVQGQVVVQLKSGSINITPGWENASGSPSVSWGYLVQR
jgi:hypothetical protein